MAIRNVRERGDEILTKKAREVKEITPRVSELIEDMLETMYEANGVGLAAPQVGVLKRVVVIDVGEGPVVLINPVITKTDGEQTGQEGCLSVPGKFGYVTRPMNVSVSALDANGEEVTYDAEGFFARAICHECDHLDGKLYVEQVIDGELYDVDDYLEDAQEE